MWIPLIQGLGQAATETAYLGLNQLLILHSLYSVCSHFLWFCPDDNFSIQLKYQQRVPIWRGPISHWHCFPRFSHYRLMLLTTNTCVTLRLMRIWTAWMHGGCPRSCNRSEAILLCTSRDLSVSYLQVVIGLSDSLCQWLPSHTLIGTS